MFVCLSERLGRVVTVAGLYGDCMTKSDSAEIAECKVQNYAYERVVMFISRYVNLAMNYLNQKMLSSAFYLLAISFRLS